MRFASGVFLLVGPTLLLGACSADNAGPTPSASWGPETPNFNLEVILRGDGFGLVKFRQPNDNALIIDLDTKVRDLEPNTAYVLQRVRQENPTASAGPLDCQRSARGWVR